jgi:hypothetical protein
MEKNMHQQGLTHFVPLKPPGWDYNASTVTFLMKAELGDELYRFFMSKSLLGQKVKMNELLLGDPPAVSYDSVNIKPEKKKMTVRRNFIMKKEWYMATKPVDTTKGPYTSRVVDAKLKAIPGLSDAVDAVVELLQTHKDT